MRKSDKKKNMAKVNLLVESRHLENKGINEGPWDTASNYDDFEDREAYVSRDGKLRSFTSPDTHAAGKLAYEELKELGVPVAENRWHSSDGNVLFIIDAEEEGSNRWVNPHYGSDIAKMEKWKNATYSNTVAEILAKYNLYAEWEDGATLNVRTIGEH